MNSNKNNITFDTYDYSLIDPCPSDNHSCSSSHSSSSYNSYSSSSCTPSSSSSYNSYSSSSCTPSSHSSSSCTPSSHSSCTPSSHSSCTPSSHSSSSHSCCHSCHTSSCESSSQSSHSKCSSYFQQKTCYLSGNKRTFYDNHGKCVPLPCHEEDSVKSSDYHSTNLTKYTNQSNKEFLLPNKDYFLKIILKGRIGSFNSFIIDNESIKKLRKVSHYRILDVENGYLVFFIKENNKHIDYNYYINQFHNPMEVIFIKHGLINKLIEEELDLKMYIQTLLKDDYKEYYANIFVMKKNNIKSMLSNINPVDLLFYSSQAYFLFKK